MSENTHITQSVTASPAGALLLLLPHDIKLGIDIEEAMFRQLLTLPPGESVGLGQPFSFAGNPPALGQSYEITVTTSAGDFALAASVTLVRGDREVELIASRLGAGVPSDYKVTLERLELVNQQPWLWVTVVRLPILAAAPPEEDEPEEEDDDLDEFENPDDVADLLEEMNHGRHEDRWHEEEEAGEGGPQSLNDALLDFAGGGES